MQYSGKTSVRVASLRLLGGLLLLLTGLLGFQQPTRIAHAGSVPPSFDLVLFTSADTVWGHNAFPGTELDDDHIGVSNNSGLTSGSFGTLISVFARGTDIYEQRGSHFLFQLLWSPGSCVSATGWCLVELDDNPSTVTAAAGGNGHFYQEHVDGTVWQLNGICYHCWTEIGGTNMGAQITAGDGKLFAKSTDGQTIWKYNGTPFSWTKIDQTPTHELDVSPTGVLYEMRNTTIAQGLSAFNWVTIYTNATNKNSNQLLVGARTYQETITDKGAAANFFLYNGNFNSPSWSLLPPLPSPSFFTGSEPGTISDALYVVLSDDSVWQYTPESGIWQEFSPAVAPQFVEIASPGDCIC